MSRAQHLEYGDWQTPPTLAREVLERLYRAAPRPPAAILEPTCGRGAFLTAAADRFPRAALHGFELNATHLAAAGRALGGHGATLRRADFFTVDWEEVLAALPRPLWLVGNPPWVTTSRQGALGSGNVPLRQNLRGLPGLAARTGHGSFDISEWMTLRLLRALGTRPAVVGLLLKSAVARRLIEHVEREALPVRPLGLFSVDARAHFAAEVEAVLFACATGRQAQGARRWRSYASLQARAPARSLGVADGQLTADLPRFLRTRALEATAPQPWRSGLKHDCAAVMELRPASGGGWRNGLGEAVEVEAHVLSPLLKSADLANGRSEPRRWLVTPQRSLGEDTTALARSAPKAWAYLQRHRARLDARRSSIYVGRPPFSVFGVGDYAFAPFKVAISGLYKRLAFQLVEPWAGRPVLLDDTCYFLAFDDRPAAQRALDALRSPKATAFLEARIFWDAKRPITRELLARLDWPRLARRLA